MSVPDRRRPENMLMYFILMIFCVQTKANNPDTCIESARTVTVVDSCPRTPKEFVNRISEKGCFNLEHNCGSFEYHCVINEWKTEIIEVCAPSTIIVGNVCAEYNSGGRIIQRKSDAKCKECPPVYSSAISYMYPECYTYVRDYRRSQKTTTSSPTEDLGLPQSNHSYDNSVISIYLSSSTTMKPFKKDKNDNSGTASNTSKGIEKDVIAPISVAAVLLLLLPVFSIVCWRRLRNKNVFQR
ncbi:uncharacterized protein LOC144620902 [Crassostrea virginica]